MANRPPRARSAATEAGAHSGPLLAAARIMGDGVTADIDLGGLETQGLGQLVNLATELAARAAALLSIETDRWDMTDVNAGWLGAPLGSTLTAKASLIGLNGPQGVWQIMFNNPDGLAVAHVVIKRQAKIPGGASGAALSGKAGGANAGTITSLASVAMVGGLGPAPQPETQRDRIAKAAADVIALKGFAQSTVREIADAAGMHVPTLYTHIASKDDLLELVYTWSMDRILVDVDEATANCRTAREKVSTIVRSMLARADENKRRVGVLNRELRSLPPAARERVLDRYRKLLGQMAKIISEGVEAGEFRPVDAMIVANIIDAACDMRALRPFMFDQVALAEFERSLMAFIDGGLARTDEMT